jgi:hypothetical protein
MRFHMVFDRPKIVVGTEPLPAILTDIGAMLVGVRS